MQTCKALANRKRCLKAQSPNVLINVSCGELQRTLEDSVICQQIQNPAANKMPSTKDMPRASAQDLLGSEPAHHGDVCPVAQEGACGLLLGEIVLFVPGACVAGSCGISMVWPGSDRGSKPNNVQPKRLPCQGISVFSSLFICIM